MQKTILLNGLCLIALSASTCSALAQETPRFTPNLSQRLQSERTAHTQRADLWAWRMRTRPVAPRRAALGQTVELKVEQPHAPASVFPSNWQWSSERNRAVDWDIPGEQRVAQNWNLGIGVPVAHRFGTARISANYREQGGGVASDAGTATAADSSAKSVALQQDLKLGNLSGSAKVALSQNASRAFDAPANAPDDTNIATESEARLKWQLKPNIALTTSHESRLQNDSDVQMQDEQPSIAEQLSRRNNREIGLQWKWSKSLSLNASAGQTRFDQKAKREDGEVALSARDEDRAILNLQRRTSAGTLGVSVSRQWAQEAVNPQDRRSDALSLHGERRVFDWLNLRGAWRLSGENNYLNSRFEDNAQREAEASINSLLGRFALRYADGSNRSQSGDGTSSSAQREYGIRYNAGRETGLGLAVEYSIRDQRAGQNASQWRLGVTYK